VAFAIFLICLFVFIGLGTYLGVAMSATGLIILNFLADDATSMAGIAIWNFLNSYSLTALPGFFLMGEVLVEGGLSQRMYSALSPLFERIPGQLLQSTVVLCAMFGAICGSSLATAAAIGSVTYPELKGRGYDKNTVAGTLAGAGTLGIMIPPSMAMIIYGAWTNVSVGRLFMAGIVPGVLLAILFMIYIGVLSKLRPEIFPKTNRAAWTPVLKAIRGTAEIWPILILIFIVLGTIYLGLATATESACLGAVASVFVGFALGRLTWRGVWKALLETAKISGLLGLVITGGCILTQAVAVIGMPKQLVSVVTETAFPAALILAFTYLMYLVLGCFFDGISMMIMTLPFIFPIITKVGFDPVWLGIVMVLVMEIGQLTPPLAGNLYVMEAITGKEVRLGQLAVAVVPYWILLLLGLILITIFPQICLWLPNLLH
jgi:tripartite ATP-independent transporter DctM subunit